MMLHPPGGDFDCSKGCDLSAAPNPVCGADGITYQGACLAVCQGTTVKDPSGPCSPKAGAMLNLELPVAAALADAGAGAAATAAGTVSLETINM